MSEKRYSLHDVTQSLRISPDTLYRWETQIPHLKPDHCDGARQYTSWEFDLVQHAHRLFHNYNQDFAGTRSALERWISKNPKPVFSGIVDRSQLSREADIAPSQSPRELLNQELSSDLKLGSGLEAVDENDDSNSKANSNTIATNNKLNDRESNYASQKLELNESSDSDLLETQNLANRPINLVDSLDSGQSNDPERSTVSVIKQDGGRKRVIGRSDEDLFADLDSDPFDLSPSPLGREYGFNKRVDSLSSANHLVPSLLDMERKHSLTGKSSQLEQDSRQKHPSNSDWLERSTAVDESPISGLSSEANYRGLLGQESLKSSTYRAQNFSPKPAFSRPESEEEQSYNTDLPAATLSSLQVDKQVLPQKEPDKSESYTTRGKYQGAPLTPIPVKKTIKSPYGAKTKPLSNYNTNNTASYPAVSSTPLIAPNDRPVTTRKTENEKVVKALDMSLVKGKADFDGEDAESWQRAYHNSQAQLARTKGELARSQERLEQQNKEIKQLKHQFYSIRESILKEIYDLKDLVVDK